MTFHVFQQLDISKPTSETETGSTTLKSGHKISTYLCLCCQFTSLSVKGKAGWRPLDVRCCSNLFEHAQNRPRVSIH